MRIKLLFVIAGFLALPFSAQADERGFRQTTGKCLLVVVNGQPVERRFPNAQPHPGKPHMFSETTGTIEVVINTVANSCSVWDSSVTIDRAKEMLPEILLGERITDVEETFYGRGEPALKGLFNKSQQVMVVYSEVPAGGSEYTVLLPQ